jgi:hypothetical protein
VARPWWRTILVAAFVLIGARGNWNDTATGIDLNNLPHFRLAKVGTGPLKDGARVTFDGIIATRRLEEVRLNGRGKSGKRWVAHLCASCMVDVWRADLDGNGIQDYFFFGGGPLFNGRMTPLYSMTIVLMDSQGLPVPFFTVMYHGENGEAIKHLLDLNHDGRPELIISNYDEAVSDPRVVQGIGPTSCIVLRAWALRKSEELWAVSAFLWSTTGATAVVNVLKKRSHFCPSRRPCFMNMERAFRRNWKRQYAAQSAMDSLRSNLLLVANPLIPARLFTIAMTDDKLRSRIL